MHTARSRSRIVTAVLVAVAVTASAATCHASNEAASPPPPTGPAVTPVGERITVEVAPDKALSVDIANVGRISGPAGAFSEAGSITIQPMQGTFATDSALSSAGTGVDVAFYNTSLTQPLELRFSASTAPNGDAIPVVMHQADEGTWEARLADRGSDGTFTLNTAAFSINLPTWANPTQWWNGITSHLASAVGGRTTPLGCSGPPSWFHLADQHSDLVHACATTNHTSDGTEVAEVQIKSNRGVALEVTVPGSPAYVWVEGQSWDLRTHVGSKLGFDPNTTVILPPGATMTAGYTQGNISAPWSFFVTGATGYAVIYSLVRAIVQFAAGELAENAFGGVIFPFYLIAECASDIEVSVFGSRVAPKADLLHVLECVTGKIPESLRDTNQALKIASQFGGDPSKVAALAKKLKALGWLVTLWPAYQIGWGNVWDKIRELLSDGDNAKVTYHFDPAPNSPPSAPDNGAGVTLPAEPTNMSVASTTTTSAALTWIDASSNEDGFTSQYRIGNGSWMTGPSAGANVTSMTVTGLTAGTTYTFQVGSRNSAGTHWSAYFYGATAQPAASYQGGFAATVDRYATTGLSGHEGPGNQYAAGPTYPIGITIRIYCYVNGQSITNSHYNYTTTIWNLSDDGYWYTDAWLYTGVNGAVVPQCR